VIDSPSRRRGTVRHGDLRVDDRIQLPGLSEAKYRMAIWRVTYETVGIDGRPTISQHRFSQSPH
jgi:hypothetical protein